MKLILPLTLMSFAAGPTAFAQAISAVQSDDLDGVGEGVFQIAEDTIAEEALVTVDDSLHSSIDSSLLDLQRRVSELGVDLKPAAEVPVGNSLQAKAKALDPVSEPLALASINCSIRPDKVVELAAPMEGIVSKVYVKPGALVAKGDLLLELDSTLLESDATLAQAEAEADARLGLAEQRLLAAQTIFETTKSGYDNKVVSRLEYERAQADLALAQRDVVLEQEVLDLAKLRADRAFVALGKTKITAPVDGVIGEDLASPGETTSGSPLLTITVVQPLRVAAIVPQTRLSDILIAQDFSVRVGVDSPREYQVAMDYVSPTVDQASNTILAFFTFETNEVVPGQRCRLVAK